MFWYLCSSCMFPAAIVEIYKFPKFISNSKLFFYPIMLSKSDDNGLWIVLLKASTAPWLWEWNNYPKTCSTSIFQSNFF